MVKSESWPPSTVLTYHELVFGGNISRYSLHCHQFEEQLALFQDIQQKSARFPVITFDDGHRSNHRYALPLLHRHCVKAVFFLTVGRIGVDPQSMDWAEVKQIRADGHEIQAHGMTHRFLTQCSDDDLWSELKKAKECLEDKSEFPVSAVSIPGGRVDSRVLEFAKRAGYSRVYVSTPWTNEDALPGLRVIGRVMVRSGMSLRKLEGLVRQTNRAKLTVRAEDCVKRIAKLGIGESIYQKVWSIASGR